jgi:parallel beta-helix repeat protein
MVAEACGLSIGEDHNIKVEGLTLQGESDLGGSMAGIQIDDASDVIVMGCTINGYQAVGVQLNGANRVTITGNNISASDGIYGTANDSVFRNNDVTVEAETFGEGVNLMGTGNLVENNFLLNTDVEGEEKADLGIAVGSHNRVLGNAINQFYYGIEITRDSNRVFKNFVVEPFPFAMGTGVNGIEADSGAIHNRIRGNIVSGYAADLYDSTGRPA